MLVILPMFVLMLLSPIAYPYIVLKLLLTDPAMLITILKESAGLWLENVQLLIESIMELLSLFH